MNWHYAENGQQQGPVSDEELRQLLQTGRITADTLVWHEGMPDWLPCRQALAAPAPPVLPSSPPVAPLAFQPKQAICAECGQYFPPDELVTLNKTLVCARCKPLFLQRLAEGVTATGAGLWREGNKLVTRSETPFPDRCVKCNAPANGFRLRQVLYWQHPAYYLLILCNLLVLLIVLLIVRKKAVLQVGLCETHRQQRKTALLACCLGLLGGIGMIIGGALAGSGLLAVAGVLILLTGLIWGIVKGRTVVATRIENENVWVGGVCREFLDQLPER